MQKLGYCCDWSLLWLLIVVFARDVVMSSSVNLQVSLDPNRPVGLYEAPQTYRRDARGRPFKSIIIRANPFNSDADNSNVIRDRSINKTSDIANQQQRNDGLSTTTASPLPANAAPNGPFKPFLITSKPFGFSNTNANPTRSTGTHRTTTTTISPVINGKVTPTIPFFSISCTVGSSCSQIISARQTPTAKPTFKPYTQDEISKFKGSLGSAFQSSVLKVNQQQQPTSSRTTSTTPGLTTNSESETKKWKWPIEDIDRNSEKSSFQVSIKDVQLPTTQPPKLSTWTPQLTIDAADIDSSAKNRNKTPFRVKPYQYLDRQTATASTSTTTQRTPTSGWISLLAETLRNGLQQNNKQSSESLIKQPTFHKPQYLSNSQQSSSSVEASNTVARQPVSPSTWKPENHREVISLKGNKISLITGPSNRQTINKQPSTPSATLPPEVSVSSHLIGLRVKPKSLNFRGNIENIQGVAVETDGENVNLSDLIMSQPLPPRPARNLIWTQERPHQWSRENFPQIYRKSQYFHDQQNEYSRQYHYNNKADSYWYPITSPGL